MRARHKLSTLVVLFALLVSAVPSGAGAQPRSADAPVNVKIAVAVPLTGRLAAWGTGVQRGTELAVHDYASALASAGVAVTVLGFDDQSDPARATANAADIVADSSILGVVGHVNSGCSIEAGSVYATSDLVMVSPISSSPELTKQGLNNVFRTCASDDGQGAYLADTAVRNLRLTRAYVVHDSTPYGKGLASPFKARFVADGGTVVGNSAIAGDDRTFTALVKKIKAKKPTVVFYGGLYHAGAPLAKQLKATGVTATFVGGEGLVDPDFVRLAGTSAAAGALSSRTGLPFDQMPGGTRFRDGYTALFPGMQPSAPDAFAYDAATAIIKAIIKVADEGGLNALLEPDAREAVRGKVASSEFDGVTGDVAFTAAGDTQYPAFSAWRVKSGSWKSCARVGKPVVPATVPKDRTFAVSGSLAPHHTAGSKAVTVKFWRKVGSKWMLGKTATAVVADADGLSAYSARVKLPTRGAWRAIATHSDGSHASMDSVVSTFQVR